MSIVFIILKITDVLFLSWWWIILALLFDFYQTHILDKVRRAGYDEGYESRKDEED